MCACAPAKAPPIVNREYIRLCSQLHECSRHWTEGDGTWIEPVGGTDATQVQIALELTQHTRI